MRKVIPISSIADEVLAEVNRTEQVKVAEAEAVRKASLPPRGELSSFLHKLAEDLRGEPEDVTYDDLKRHLAGGAA